MFYEFIQKREALAWNVKNLLTWESATAVMSPAAGKAFAANVSPTTFEAENYPRAVFPRKPRKLTTGRLNFFHS